MSFKKDGKVGEPRRYRQAVKSISDQGESMKCTHLTASGSISACSALEKPYVPSLFEPAEYCRKNEHRKCPLYLKGIICMNHGEGGARQASL
jgi:hypothetical protein